MSRSLEATARRMAGPLLLLIISIGLFWKLVLSGGQFTWLNSPDLSTQVLPWFNFQAREWNRHHFPLWDPYNWGGQSLVGRTEPGVMFPLNWLLFLAPLDNGRISIPLLNWYYVLTHYLGALFAYLLCRDLGRGITASVLAGTLFGLGGFAAGNGWPQIWNGAIWGPLVLLFFLRAMRGDRPVRNTALSGAFFGIAWLAGHHQIPTFLMLLMAGLWLYYFFAQGMPVRRFAVLAAVFACFALLLGAAQLLPSYEYGKRAVRWVGSQQDPLGWNDKVSYDVHVRYSNNPVSLLGIVLPAIHPLTSPFVGFAAAALALIAVLSLWERKEVRIFGAVAVAAFLFTLGPNTVFHGVLYSVAPMLDKARNPAMALYIFHLAVPVLAAFGLDALGEPRVGSVAGKIAIGLWAAAAIIWVVLFGAYVSQGESVYYRARQANGAIAALLAGGALWASKRGALTRRALTAGLLLLVIFELGGVAGFEFMHRSLGWGHLDALENNGDIARFLKGQDGLFRVEVSRADIPFNFGEWHEIEECGGNSGVTANIYRVNAYRNAHLLLGERFRVAQKPDRDGAVEVFRGASGLKVFLNNDAFPRLWTVHVARSLANEKQIAPAIEKPPEELRRSTFVVGDAPPLEACPGGDEVRVLERGKNRTLIQTRMACRGMLIVGDTWFHGWQARVDGRTEPIYEAYGFLRGVVVEAGEHKVELRYRPSSVIVGGTLTGLGLVAVAVLLFKTRRRTIPRASLGYPG